MKKSVCFWDNLLSSLGLRWVKSKRIHRRRPVSLGESLEARVVLTASAIYDTGSHALTMTGDANTDTITVGSLHSGSNDYVKVYVNGQSLSITNGTNLATSAVSHISVVGHEDNVGSETIDLSAVTGTAQFPSNLTTEIDGNGGADTILGSAFADAIQVRAGVSSIDGGVGSDEYHFNACPSDSIDANVVESAGNAGTDLLTFDLVGVSVDLANPDQQQVYSGTDGDVFVTFGYNWVENADGTSGDDVLLGNPFINRLRGFGGGDRLSGFEGDDTLEGGGDNDVYDFNDPNDDQGIDTIIDSSGTDTLDFTSSGAVTVDLAQTGSTQTLAAGSTPNQNYSNGRIRINIASGTVLEDVWGSSGGDTIYGNDADNHLFGYGGNDTLIGDDGNDLLIGGSGNDTLMGEADNDVIVGEEGNDSLYGGTGNDRYVFFGSHSLGTDSISDSSTGTKNDTVDVGNMTSADTSSVQPLSSSSVSIDSGRLVLSANSLSNIDTVVHSKHFEAYFVPDASISGATSILAGNTYSLSLSITVHDAVTPLVDHWLINWGDGSSVQTVASTATSVSHVFSTASSTPYVIRAVAVTASDSFDATATVAVEVGSIPNAPLTLSGNLNGSQLTLSWDDNSNNETSFVVQRSLNGSSWTDYRSCGANATSDSFAIGSTHYYYRVIARNAFGDGVPTSYVYV